MQRFEVILGDITKVQTDVIVNAANTSLLGGSGVDGAIHRAAGPELLAECQQLGGCETGQAKATNAYALPCRYVIHTPGPVWHGGTQEEDALLASCYRNALALAAQLGCRTMAFPSISTGVYRFPLARAAKIAVNAICQALHDDYEMESVTMVCFDELTKSAYERALAERSATDG